MNEGARVIDIFSYEEKETISNDDYFAGYDDCLKRYRKIEQERRSRHKNQKLERRRNLLYLAVQKLLGLFILLATVFLIKTGTGEDVTYALLTIPAGFWMLLTNKVHITNMGE